MKKKLLVFTLCFTLIFSSLNYKRSYADGGIISLPMLATVSALAVGAGIVINNNEGLYDIGSKFYDYVKAHNELTWESINAVFLSSVSILNNKLVSVDSKFLDIVKGFFDNSYSDFETGFLVSSNYGVPHFDNYDSFKNFYMNSSSYSFNIKDYSEQSFYIGNVYFDNESIGSSSDYRRISISFNGEHIGSVSLKVMDSIFNVATVVSGGNVFLGIGERRDKSWYNFSISHSPVFDSSIVLDGYEWDNVESKKDNDKVSLPIPGDLGSLVGQNKDTFWDNTDNLIGTGGVVIPGVDDPSISVDGTIDFPIVGDTPSDAPGVGSPSVPNEGIWVTIKDFIIGLVVPGDTFWTDTWSSLYNNFTDSFPMVDMDGFNDLVTGEKKFPNIDIDIMGVSGRVVNGDVVNSIVNWLRPIIAGFMMLCLMFFNYRKIYKLIRNSEPFEGIGKVENHAN